MRSFSEIWRKFQAGEYRKAFVRAEVKRLVPFQIRALRLSRKWSQEELAERAGLTQGAISRAEDPDYGNLTFNTVIRIANGFDVAFIGKFVPYSELAKWYADLSEASAGSVPSFDVENAAVGVEQTPTEEARATLQPVSVPALSAIEGAFSGAGQEKPRPEPQSQSERVFERLSVQELSGQGLPGAMTGGRLARVTG